MKRAALVIGNAAYSDQPLTNPGNDAEDMAGTLRKYGFVVHKAVDSTCLEMERALKDFRAELYDADVGLFFFAGHGVQVRFPLGWSVQKRAEGRVTLQLHQRYKVGSERYTTV